MEMIDKTCEKCNVEIQCHKWSQHIKTKMHLTNDPDQTIKPGIFGRPRIFNHPTKLCKKCNVEIVYSSWPKHLRPKNI